jgi:hypothetical protein
VPKLLKSQREQNQMNTKEQIEIMQAFVDGKEIESKGRHDNEWSPNLTPQWDWIHYDYRIKCVEEKSCYDCDNYKNNTCVVGSYGYICHNYSRWAPKKEERKCSDCDRNGISCPPMTRMECKLHSLKFWEPKDKVVKHCDNCFHNYFDGCAYNRIGDLCCNYNKWTSKERPYRNCTSRLLGICIECSNHDFNKYSPFKKEIEKLDLLNTYASSPLTKIFGEIEQKLNEVIEAVNKKR